MNQDVIQDKNLRLRINIEIQCCVHIHVNVDIDSFNIYLIKRFYLLKFRQCSYALYFSRYKNSNE